MSSMMQPSVPMPFTNGIGGVGTGEVDAQRPARLGEKRRCGGRGPPTSVACCLLLSPSSQPRLPDPVFMPPLPPWAFCGAISADCMPCSGSSRRLTGGGSGPLVGRCWAHAEHAHEFIAHADCGPWASAIKRAALKGFFCLSGRLGLVAVGRLAIKTAASVTAFSG